jgi:hypothetical protein
MLSINNSIKLNRAKTIYEWSFPGRLECCYLLFGMEIHDWVCLPLHVLTYDPKVKVQASLRWSKAHYGLCCIVILTCRL